MRDRVECTHSELQVAPPTPKNPSLHHDTKATTGPPPVYPYVRMHHHCPNPCATTHDAWVMKKHQQNSNQWQSVMCPPPTSKCHHSPITQQCPEPTQPTHVYCHTSPHWRSAGDTPAGLQEATAMDAFFVWADVVFENSNNHKTHLSTPSSQELCQLRAREMCCWSCVPLPRGGISAVSSRFAQQYATMMIPQSSPPPPLFHSFPRANSVPEQYTHSDQGLVTCAHNVSARIPV